MDLLGRAKKWVKGMAPVEPPEPQPFRVRCPEGHVIRGRRTEGYQALRCPECGEGVFVLPMSPLPMPPIPSSRTEQERAAERAFDDSPIPLSDHVPDPMQESEDIEWLEPVEPIHGTPLGNLPGFDPVEAAVSELPSPDLKPASSPQRPRARPAADRPAGPGTIEPAGTGSRRTQAPVAGPGPKMMVPVRPSLGGRLRRNRPILVSLAVVGVLVGTVAWILIQNQRSNAPALVQQGREEGIPALNRGEFDQAHRILSRASAAVDALGGQIGGAEEVRQAAREAAIFVDLIPDRLEDILDLRARSSDESEWQRTFDRSYKNRSILISARVVSTPSDPSGRYELNYRILAVGPLAPREARIDFEGFRLFELGAPETGWQILFGARLASIESDPDGWRFRLQPNSGVTMTHQDALQALGWNPVETASAMPGIAPGLPVNPILLTTLLTPPVRQGLRGETPDQVRIQLGAPRSFARSVSQGEYVEQWIYESPSGARQYLNFVRSTGRSGPPVVDQDFFVR